MGRLYERAGMLEEALACFQRARMVDSLRAPVERAVGLVFTSPPRSAMRTKEQVRGYLIRKLDEELPPDRLRGLETTYRLFGLLPDTLHLRAPGRTMLKADGRGIPVSAVPVEGTEYDFREPRPIGATKLDHAFTDLERDHDGLARVDLREMDSGDTLTVWLGESYRYLQLFTGDPLPDVDRRSLAVEPMTCAPNAFRSGDGLLVLEPGESATATWGIQP